MAGIIKVEYYIRRDEEGSYLYRIEDEISYIHIDGIFFKSADSNMKKKVKEVRKYNRATRVHLIIYGIKE